MTFQIQVTRRNETKLVKNAIDMKVMNFETRDHAEHFANSMFQNARCDWKNQGRRLPKFEVVEVGA
jgi:hypothetical protein